MKQVNDVIELEGGARIEIMKEDSNKRFGTNEPLFAAYHVGKSSTGEYHRHRLWYAGSAQALRDYVMKYMRNVKKGGSR